MYCVNICLDEYRRLQSQISCAYRCYCTNHIHFLDGLLALVVGCSTKTVGLPVILITVT